MNTYTVGSLFTGIGGIDLAFVRAGFEIAWQVEIDPFCRKVLAKHAPEYWPKAEVHEDVRNVGRDNLKPVTVMVGGFPCQDISSAGKRQGIKEGNRSGLWFEFARIIGELRPRVVMLENVAAITHRDGTRVIADLTALGYDAEWGIISAADAGASHRRERWWCVAYRQNEGINRRNGQQENDANSRPQRQAVAASGSDGRLSDVADYSERERKPSRSPSMEPRAAIETVTSSKPMVDPDGSRLQITGSSYSASAAHGGTKPAAFGASTGQAQSILGRAVDGLSRRLDGARWPARPGQPQHAWEAPRTTSAIPDRAARLTALGNAVVPQVVQPIAEAIYASLEAETAQRQMPDDPARVDVG